MKSTFKLSGILGVNQQCLVAFKTNCFSTNDQFMWIIKTQPTSFRLKIKGVQVEFVARMISMFEQFCP